MAEQFIASKQLPMFYNQPVKKTFLILRLTQWFKNENSPHEVGYVGQRQGRIFNQ